MKKELYKDKHFEFLEDRPFKIKDFRPSQGVYVDGDGDIKFKSKVKMYGEITIEVKEDGYWTTYIASLYHKADFKTIWDVFSDPSGLRDKEIIAIWTRNHYANPFNKRFPKVSPKYVVFIGEKGSIDTMPGAFRWTDEDDFYTIIGNVNPVEININSDIFKVK